MRKIFPLLILLFWLPSTALTSISIENSPAIIRVPSDYPTIQGAINAASDGSIIVVSSGVYSERVMINKSLTLLGEDRRSTVINGGGGFVVVNITANKVTFNGFTVLNGRDGVDLTYSNNSVISGNIITQNCYGITLGYSNDCTISDNEIIYPAISPLIQSWAIALWDSHNNRISGNNITDTHLGIVLSGSNNNLIDHNLFTRNQDDITFWGGSDNYRIEYNIFAFTDTVSISSTNYTLVHHNLFIASSVTMSNSYHTFWNSSQRGNYWDAYTGLDNGSNNRTAGDGVGDTNIPYLDIDYYPLINPPLPIPVFWNNTAYPVGIVSNSTVSGLRFNQGSRKISFNLNGTFGTTGFFNVSIPKTLLRGPWGLSWDQGGISSGIVITENETHTNVYFSYPNKHWSMEIVGTYVVPEYSNGVLLMVMLLSIVSIALLKKKLKT